MFRFRSLLIALLIAATTACAASDAEDAAMDESGAALPGPRVALNPTASGQLPSAIIALSDHRGGR